MQRKCLEVLLLLLCLHSRWELLIKVSFGLFHVNMILIFSKLKVSLVSLERMKFHLFLHLDL